MSLDMILMDEQVLFFATYFFLLSINLTNLLPVNRLIFYLSVNQRSLSSDRQRTFAVRPPLCVVIIGSVMCEQPIWTVELWLWGIQLSARSISTLVFVVIVNRGGCE